MGEEVSTWRRKVVAWKKPGDTPRGATRADRFAGR